MSNCRCTEIRICEAKIRKLEAAAEQMDCYATPYVNITQQLDNIANNSGKTYHSDDIFSVTGALKILPEDIDEAGDIFQSALGKVLKELRSERADLKKEDKDYHDNNTTTNTSTASTGS